MCGARGARRSGGGGCLAGRGSPAERGRCLEACAASGAKVATSAAGLGTPGRSKIGMMLRPENFHVFEERTAMGVVVVDLFCRPPPRPCRQLLVHGRIMADAGMPPCGTARTREHADIWVPD